MSDRSYSNSKSSRTSTNVSSQISTTLINSSTNSGSKNKRLRKEYNNSISSGNSFIIAINDELASDDCHKVEKVVNKKTYKGKVYYKLQWAGCEEPTWELAQNCTCNYLIEQYENESNQNEDDNEWEVEQILDKRIRNDRVEYLVKWRGWLGGPTWELSDNCECFNLIAAYENPKLKKLWNFQGSNQNLWLGRKTMLKYMERYIRQRDLNINLLRFESDFPADEKQLDLEEGMNIGPLCYESHWYIVIILVNHICVTRRILVGDSLNTLIGTTTKGHPVIKRLSRVYTHFPIKPIRLTQMDRSDVCAFYTLAAFERAIFLLNEDAQFIIESVFFDASRAELIRSDIKPESDGEISVSLPIPEAFDHGPICEFCDKMFESRKMVDDHIYNFHIVAKRRKSSSI